MAAPTAASRSNQRHGEAGQVVVLVAFAISALLGVGVMAADLGLLRVARGQLQAAAVSTALAGAKGLRHGDATVALELATLVAESNRALGDGMQPLSLLPADMVVTGPRSVQVTLRRAPETGGGVRTFFTTFVGLGHEWRMAASAEAETIELCGTEGLRPLAIPDRWSDLNGDGIYDDGEPYVPAETGYQPLQDEGLVITVSPFEMRGEEPATIASYLRTRLPPVDSGQGNPRPGVGNYRRFLREGAPYEVQVGDEFEVQTVWVHCTTYQVLSDLIAADPDAYWDPQLMRVVSEAEALSPRILKAALLDPRTLPEVPVPRCQRRNLVRVSRLVAVFLEDVASDGTITLRIVPLAGDGVDCTGDEVSFVYRSRVVR